MPREHNEAGDFVETVSLDDVLDVFDAVRGLPVVTSADVSDALDCSRDTARRKLKELHRQERVARRKTAGRIIWWRTADVNESETMLRRLSRTVDEAIVVGDRVYEDGDAHPLTESVPETEERVGGTREGSGEGE